MDDETRWDGHDGRAVLPRSGARLRSPADRLGDSSVRHARRLRPGERIARALGAIPAGRVTLVAATLAMAGALAATAAGDGTPEGGAERAQSSLAEQSAPSTATPDPS